MHEGEDEDGGNGGGDWKDADEQLGEDEEFASDDEEINSDEC